MVEWGYGFGVAGKMAVVMMERGNGIVEDGRARKKERGVRLITDGWDVLLIRTSARMYVSP